MKNENVLEQVNTEVTLEAIDKLTDTNVPTPFSTSVAADREMILREDALLSSMHNQIKDK